MSRCLTLALLCAITAGASPLSVTIRGTLDHGVAGSSPLVPSADFLITFEADTSTAVPEWDQGFAEFRLNVVATWRSGHYVHTAPATAAYYQSMEGDSGVDLRWFGPGNIMLQALFVPDQPLFSGPVTAPVLARGSFESAHFELNHRVVEGFESYAPATYVASDGAVPEPSTLVLLAGGMAPLMLLRRR